LLIKILVLYLNIIKTNIMIQETHLGLVKFTKEAGIIAVIYYKSKFKRELGDTINFNNTTYKVGVIANNRNEVISTLNSLIYKQNKINKQKQVINTNAQLINNLTKFI